MRFCSPGKGGLDRNEDKKLEARGENEMRYWVKFVHGIVRRTGVKAALRLEEVLLRTMLWNGNTLVNQKVCRTDTKTKNRKKDDLLLHIIFLTS